MAQMSYSRDLHALGSFRILNSRPCLGFVSYFPGYNPVPSGRGLLTTSRAYPLAIYFPLTIAGPKKLP
jgi:hypothetical protein